MDCAAMLDNWLVIAATAADIAVRDKLAKPEASVDIGLGANGRLVALTFNVRANDPGDPALVGDDGFAFGPGFNHALN